MSNDKKMPNTGNTKPGAQDGLDQKKPQSDRGIGHAHERVKPDNDDKNELDDEDDRITQRTPAAGNDQRK